MCLTCLLLLYIKIQRVEWIERWRVCSAREKENRGTSDEVNLSATCLCYSALYGFSNVKYSLLF